VAEELALEECDSASAAQCSATRRLGAGALLVDGAGELALAGAAPPVMSTVARAPATCFAVR